MEIKLQAFDGVVGQILAIDEASRITVLVDMMRRRVKLQVDADNLAPVLPV